MIRLKDLLELNEMTYNDGADEKHQSRIDQPITLFEDISISLQPFPENSSKKRSRKKFKSKSSRNRSEQTQSQKENNSNMKTNEYFPDQEKPKATVNDFLFR